MLAEWKLGGWAATMARHPEPDDLIIPLLHADRRRTRTGEAFWGHDYAGERQRRDDLPALGWRHRRHYDTRATFITLAIEDGADKHLFEERVTHAKKQRSAFDGYNRGAPVGEDMRRGRQAQDLSPAEGPGRGDRAAGRSGRRGGRSHRFRRLSLQCSLQSAQRRGIAR
jgi:hypothetical protein